ncbi:hypothetical protein [Flavobacterium orientale]|nr:hypothetical protein [Flavobacterium orientale]
MKKTLLFVLLLHCIITWSQNDLRLPFEPRPEELLPEVKKMKEIKSIEISHFTTDLSDDFVAFTNNKTILLFNRYPQIVVFTVDPMTKDTTQNKIVYTYHTDTDTLATYKEFRLGQTKHLYYDKKGRIEKKNEFFNGKMEGQFFWFYEGELLSKDERIIRGKKYTHEFKYDDSKRLIEKVSYSNGVFQGNVKWFYDANGNMVKEESLQKDVLTTKNSTYNLANQLLTQTTTVNEKVIQSLDYNSVYASSEKEKEKNDKREKFMKRKTFYTFDTKGNWVLKKFLNDEKYYDFDQIDGKYHVKKRVIVYK